MRKNIFLMLKIVFFSFFVWLIQFIILSTSFLELSSFKIYLKNYSQLSFTHLLFLCAYSMIALFAALYVFFFIPFFSYTFLIISIHTLSINSGIISENVPSSTTTQPRENESDLEKDKNESQENI